MLAIRNFRPVPVLLMSLALGCTSHTPPVNQKLSTSQSTSDYTLQKYLQRPNHMIVMLSFSGGGSRAAALSYGVLEALAQTQIQVDGQSISLIDEVDVVSAVSGGSFTAAYLGLYGHDKLEQYRQDFLYQEVSHDIASHFLSPFRWMVPKNLTADATNYYQDHIFGDAIFSDIDNTQSPYIIINASDITTRTRFSFTPEYFDLLCSNVDNYPISSAVMASSAVPVLFPPVVLENYPTCESTPIPLELINHGLPNRSQQFVDSLDSYRSKKKNQYIHLVDGGITDNLGLLAIYELMEHYEAEQILNASHSSSSIPFVIISVDASTSPELGIGRHSEAPSIKDTLDAVTDIQLHCYNDSTKDLILDSMQKWSQEGSTKHKVIKPYFIEISVQNVQDAKLKAIMNEIPTDFTLEADSIDIMITEGRQQLLNLSEFQTMILQHTQ